MFKEMQYNSSKIRHLVKICQEKQDLNTDYEFSILSNMEDMSKIQIMRERKILLNGIS